MSDNQIARIIPCIWAEELAGERVLCGKLVFFFQNNQIEGQDYLFWETNAWVNL